MQAILAKQYTDAKLEIAQAREAILADARKEVANIEQGMVRQREADRAELLKEFALAQELAR